MLRITSRKYMCLHKPAEENTRHLYSYRIDGLSQRLSTDHISIWTIVDVVVSATVDYTQFVPQYLSQMTIYTLSVFVFHMTHYYKCIGNKQFVYVLIFLLFVLLIFSYSRIQILEIFSLYWTSHGSFSHFVSHFLINITFETIGLNIHYWVSWEYLSRDSWLALHF